jgi:phage gp46-like protein
VLVSRVIERMEADLVRVRADASTVVRMTLSQMREERTLAILDEMAELTTQVASGWFDPSSGEDTGGSLWILARLQSLASISLHRASARADEQ